MLTRTRNTALFGCAGIAITALVTLVYIGFCFAIEAFIEPWSGFVALALYTLFLLPLMGLLLYGGTHFMHGCGITAGWFVLSIVVVAACVIVALYIEFWLAFTILALYTLVIGTIAVAVIAARLAYNNTVVVATPVVPGP